MKFCAQRKTSHRGLLYTALSITLLLMSTFTAMAAGNELDKNGIAAMIPKDSVGFFMIDTPWWYQNVVAIKDADGKSILSDNPELKQFEEKYGISLEQDIMSWAGRVGICLLAINETEPVELDAPPLNDEEVAVDDEFGDEFNFDDEDEYDGYDGYDPYMMQRAINYDASLAVLLEVRDRATFLAKLPTLMQKLPTGEKALIWKEDFYAGIAVRRSEVDIAGMLRPLALAEVNGWLVFAVGDNALEKIIDTVNGKSPPFTDIPGMKDALAQLPEKSYTLFGFNDDADLQMSQIPSDLLSSMLGWSYYLNLFRMLSFYPSTQLAGMAGIAAYSETENGLQLSTTLLATSEASQKVFKRYQAMLKPPAGKVLKQLPAGTFAIMNFCNPGALLFEIKKSMLASLQDEDSRRDYEEIFAQIQPLQDIMSNITGEFAFAGAWSKENGAALLMLGEHDTAIKAADSNEKLKRTVTSYDVPVVNKQGMSVLQMPRYSDEESSLQPGWMIKNNLWLAISSNVSWLKKAGPVKLPQLPTTPKGANSTFVADLSFLTAFYDKQEKTGEMTKEKRTEIDAFQFQNIKLIGYSKISDDARSAYTVCQLNNWDWRHALSLLSVEIANLTKASSNARSAKTVSNLKQLALAGHIYIQENDETLPPFQQVWENIGVPEKVIMQPGTELPYLYNEKIAGKKLGAFNNPTDTVFFYEQQPSEDGHRYVAFLDGHVESVSEERWAELMKDEG